MIQERCSQPEAVAIRLEAVLVHVNACRVSVAGTVNDPHDRSSDQTSIELSRLLFVTLEDVVIGRCQMHQATESHHTAVPTEHMLHSTQTLGAKRERLRETVSTTSMRTVEVTI